MTARIDHFATTVRGLFLGPDPITREMPEVSLLDAPLSSGAVAVAEVASAPAGCAVDRLEVIEPLPGSTDAWQTREVPLKPGMRVAVALGGRFANRGVPGRGPDRPVPPGATLDLLNVGGVTGLSNDPQRPVVKLRILGGVDRDGRPALMRDLPSIPGGSAPVYEDGAPFSSLVLVVGSEMEVGKTTCAASAAVALRAAGIRVTYAKLTGTGRMRDLMRVNYGRNEGFFDAMRLAWDFVDAGLATTFEIPAKELRRRARLLLGHAALHGEVVVAELADSPCADGSIAAATDPWLLNWLRHRGLVICACDTLGSTHIVDWIRRHMGVGDENLLISGIVANDPALRREVERMTGAILLNCTSPGGHFAYRVLHHIMSRQKEAA
ncbi:MAG: hypothetical protein A3I72_15660 [Candidatus Tectomicrobia bacterium RIFCSPLOWO2_02_FULL_70_19]|nr:MAG: hypothetical protein A3I72_15660 [Candidatus Tectomicrobia bacterium RIFCSPLOWO2_02_FULL_70_19]